jgi:hypothetical protein
MNGKASSLTRKRGETEFPGAMHVAHFPNADPKNPAWFMSCLYIENLQMNNPIPSS